VAFVVKVFFDALESATCWLDLFFKHVTFDPQPPLCLQKQPFFRLKTTPFLGNQFCPLLPPTLVPAPPLHETHKTTSNSARIALFFLRCSLSQ